MSKPILITGCARTGTSLLTLLMTGFNSLDVVTSREVSPLDFRPRSRRTVIKYPQGGLDPTADFGIPLTWADPSRCYLKNYLADWQVLICLRDARDILVSRHPTNPTQYHVSPERCRGALVRDIEALRQPNTLAVYYERLVADPRAVMSEVAAFIGEEYDYSVIDTFYDRAEKGVPAGGQLVFATNGLRPIDQNSVGAWRRAEHRPRVAAIADYYHQYIESLLRQLGYRDCELPVK